jgi:hypothetical protein
MSPFVTVLSVFLSHLPRPSIVCRYNSENSAV